MSGVRQLGAVGCRADKVSPFYLSINFKAGSETGHVLNVPERKSPLPLTGGCVRMTNPQLHPLEVNPATGEPFLRLKRHRNIIITPPRMEDAQFMLEPMNDDRVHIWLASPPYPYSIEHAEKWVASVKSKADLILGALGSALDDSQLILADGCPVRFLREIKDDGAELFIGDVGMFRCTYGELMGPHGLDWDTKTEYEEKNNGLPAGDPGIVWSIGDFLVGSHHGRGIMTDAVKTIIEEWAVRRMNCRRIAVSVFTENGASMRVFTKNGFRETRRIEPYMVAKGVQRGVALLEWRVV
ncbi:hypothetical protein AX15_004025 [Amanita polypyramis BW_CC]|nr:hypothetical protein AX15_004025 [Amanita polypyramis BW_CC]